MDQQLNEKVNKIEIDTIAGQKEKLLRDKLDYELNNDYVWKKIHPWGPYGHAHKKQVCFSDTEIMANTLAMSVPDGSSNLSGASGLANQASTLMSSKNGQYKFKNKKPHHKKPTIKQEGVEKT